MASDALFAIGADPDQSAPNPIDIFDLTDTRRPSVRAGGLRDLSKCLGQFKRAKQIRKVGPMRAPRFVFCTILIATNPASLTLAISGHNASAAGAGAITFVTEGHGPAPSANEFRNSCAACHGVDGQGNGPLAVLLKVRPPDLTGLAARNGGKFPFDYVMRIIDGRATVGPHGTREMPVWGDRYMRDFPKSVTQEPHRSKTAEPLVRARILELTYYLRSIQK